MSDKIVFRKGLLENLEDLPIAAPGFITNPGEERLVIGGAKGNVFLPNAKDINKINSSLNDLTNKLTDFDLAYAAKSFSEASGTQKISTSFKPRAIICNASVNSQKIYSNGFYANKKEYSIANPSSEAASSLVYLKDSDGVKVEGKITLIEDDGVTITWTTTGTPSFGNAIEMCLILIK